MEHYGRLSEVYDRLLYDVSGAEWSGYLKRLMKQVKPKLLLEYACGSGRLTKEFALAGLDVIGVDASESMLTIAYDNLRPLGSNVKLVAAEMQEFRLQNPCDVAVCCLDGVNYLTTEQDLHNFAFSAALNLRTDGLLLFDVSTPYRLEHILGNEFFYDDGDNEVLFWQNHFRQPFLEMSLSVFVKQDTLWDRFDEDHTMRAWTADEIKSALYDAGFATVERFEFGTTNPPSDTCERIQYRAQKGGV